MKNKTNETKIKKSITHDRLAITIKFPTGGCIKFSMTHYGERVSVAGSPDPATCKQQLRAVSAFTKLRKGENNLKRLERVESLARKCASVSEFVAAL